MCVLFSQAVTEVRVRAGSPATLTMETQNESSQQLEARLNGKLSSSLVLKFLDACKNTVDATHLDMKDLGEICLQVHHLEDGGLVEGVEVGVPVEWS